MAAKNNNYKLSDEFIKKLMNFSAGYFSPETFDGIINLFEEEIARHYFTYSSESNMLRIILSMYDKISFLLDSLKYPHYAEILVSVAANSNYLTDILVLNPEFFYWIINPSVLDSKFMREKFQHEIKENLNSYKSLNAKVNYLRRAKRKEILRIGTNDILGKTGLEETTRQLSQLANVIAEELFSLCYNEVLQRHGIKDLPNKYCMIALGKLGGNELNYSSDIDLIIFYDKNGEASGKKNYNEILTEAVYLFIESASSVTNIGFIYRVDFRLRPDGRTSALCRSIDEYLDYYEIRGEDWERQMLIKAGFVCGSKTLYDKFIDYLQPFIYPASFSTSPVEQIKKLKGNIEKNLNDEDNIKLIPGGIRDIEFSVQALQLINGGSNKSLKTGNTLEAIQKLNQAGLLNKEEADTFTEAYILYRKIEHYLQLMNDSQTHTIPQEGETLEKMSAFLGFENTVLFKKQVLNLRSEVQKIFNSVMGIEDKEIKISHITSIVKFENKSRAEKDLLYLREGIGLLGQKQFDKQSIENFESIEPLLEEYLVSSISPDQVLQNFVRVIRPVTFPSIWYKEFLNKKFFHSFLYLCEYSQKSIDLFAENDKLREYFITRGVFTKLNSRNMEQLSGKKMLFTISVQFSLSLITEVEASQLLSKFFRQKIKSLAEKYASVNGIKINFAVASMGSFGAGEMSLASDIDLIFIAENMDKFPEIQSDFQKLLLTIKEDLKPVEVDCRLRPEGKSSILVWDVNSYRKYVNSRARIWELQSFCKLQFIAGEKKIFNRLASSVNKRIKSEPAASIIKEIADMRKKLMRNMSSSSFSFFNIKKSGGGIADIDFLVQYFILTSGSYSKLRGKGILKVLSSLDENLIEKSDAETLIANFLFLKKLYLSLQCIYNTSSAVVPSLQDKLNIVAKALKLNSAEDFQKQFSSVISFNQKIYKKYLGQ